MDPREHSVSLVNPETGSGHYSPSLLLGEERAFQGSLGGSGLHVPPLPPDTCFVQGAVLSVNRQQGGSVPTPLNPYLIYL